jgi:hypothetical protein
MNARTTCRHGIRFEDVTHRAICREARAWYLKQPPPGAKTLVPGSDNVHEFTTPTGERVRQHIGAGVEGPMVYHTMCIACTRKVGMATLAGMIQWKTSHYDTCPRRGRIDVNTGRVIARGFQDTGKPSPWTAPPVDPLPAVEGFSISALPDNVDPLHERAEIAHTGCGFNAKVYRATIAQACKRHLDSRHLAATN